MSATARHRIANTIAYRICQRGGHIPNRDRSLPDACDFHYREALALADLIGPILSTEDRFGFALKDIRDEAVRSIEKHGEQGHLPMGTGPATTPLATHPDIDWDGLQPSMDAVTLAELATLDTKAHSHNEGGDGTVTWWQILREEVLEAAACEEDDTTLREKLVQVAAVALKMIDALDAEAALAEAERRAEEWPR